MPMQISVEGCDNGFLVIADHPPYLLELPLAPGDGLSEAGLERFVQGCVGRFELLSTCIGRHGAQCLVWATARSQDMHRIKLERKEMNPGSKARNEGVALARRVTQGPSWEVTFWCSGDDDISQAQVLSSCARSYAKSIFGQQPKVIG